MEGDAKSRWSLQNIAYGLAVFTVLGSGIIWFVDTRYVTHAEFSADYVTQEEFNAAVESIRTQQADLVRFKNYQICVGRGFDRCACELQLAVEQRSCP